MLAVSPAASTPRQRFARYHFARSTIWIARFSHQAPTLAGPPLQGPLEKPGRSTHM
jgi:hypothetical protein